MAKKYIVVVGINPTADGALTGFQDEIMADLFTLDPSGSISFWTNDNAQNRQSLAAAYSPGHWCKVFPAEPEGP